MMFFARNVHARLAQSVERETLNLNVVGSTPTLGVIFFPFFDDRHISIEFLCNLTTINQFTIISIVVHSFKKKHSFCLLHQVLITDQTQFECEQFFFLSITWNK